MALSAEDIIDEIIRREGGYVNHPADKGGPTKFGITQATLSKHRKRQCTAADVAKLGEPEAREIYRLSYVAPFQWIADDRVRGLAVDMAVNHGPMNATKLLQRAAGVADDGVIGPATRQAVNGAGAALYYPAIGQRAKFYGGVITGNHSQAAFAAGWMNRLAEFLA